MDVRGYPLPLVFPFLECRRELAVEAGAVLEQDEDLRTVVDAQAVARAEILVDPDPHVR